MKHVPFLIILTSCSPTYSEIKNSCIEKYSYNTAMISDCITARKESARKNESGVEADVKLDTAINPK